jgi:hypothetical protein
MSRGSLHEFNLADHVLHVVVIGDVVKIDVIKSRNGLLFSNDDPRLEPVRAAVLRYIAEDVA